VLEQGVKLDNLVHIAHNVVVGAHTAMAACVGIAGSTRIGAHCTFAGQAGVVGHVNICDHVHVGAACAVTRSITKPGSYGGMFPFDENGVWDKNAATLRQLYALRGRVRALESKIT
jgi:UDP-3-O-[3-hydroxymyristoyl] glucosamine N-acyltransferase